MLVELVYLRRDGLKRSREEVRAERPLLVELAVSRNGHELSASWDEPWSYGPADYGCSKVGTTLRGARLVAMRGANFVIVGSVDVSQWGEAPRLVPQAWWCRVPKGGESARPGPPEPPTPIQIPLPDRWLGKGPHVHRAASAPEDDGPTREERRASRTAR